MGTTTSIHKETDDHFELWKNLKNQNMRDVHYEGTPRPEMLLIPETGRAGEFETV